MNYRFLSSKVGTINGSDVLEYPNKERGTKLVVLEDAVKYRELLGDIVTTAADLAESYNLRWGSVEMGAVMGEDGYIRIDFYLIANADEVLRAPLLR